jgi:hypothetical protein
VAEEPNQRGARPERFDAAVLIVDPGASNPSGVAHAIVKACAEVRAEGGSTREDPAVRLMVTQLAWLCRGNSDVEDYGELLAECRRRASDATAERADEPSAAPSSVAVQSDRTARIAALNDVLRQSRAGGRVLVTRGIEALGPERMAEIMAAVARFDAFTPDNDPHNEHDCAILEAAGEQIMFKVDLYEGGSVKPL